MILQDGEAEKSLDASIGGRFPYNDPSASALLARGWQISLNAAFCVLHELCRPPKGVDVKQVRLRELVAEWAEGGPDHPLKMPLLNAAHCLIDHAPLPWPEGAELMKRVAEFEGQRAALAIAYFASDCDDPDGDEALALLDAEIRQKWDANGV